MVVLDMADNTHYSHQQVVESTVLDYGGLRKW